MSLEFEIALEPMDMGLSTYRAALNAQRDKLLKDLASSGTDHEALLGYRAMAQVLRAQYRELKDALEREKQRREEAHPRLPRGPGRY